MRTHKIKKYFDALIDLKALTSKTNDFSISQFIHEKKLSKDFGTVLQQGGIIKKTGTHSGSRWYWNTFEPTPQMAKEVISRLSKRSLDYRNGLVEIKQIHKKRTTKAKPPKVEVRHIVAQKIQEQPVKRKPKKSWSILFGLFTKYK